MKFNRILGAGLNILYPHCCPLCHKVLKDQKAMICPECLSKLHPISGRRCPICSVPLKTSDDFCPVCSSEKRFFDHGMSIFFYDNLFKNSILKYKYGGRREYGDLYAALMSYYAKDQLARWKPDLVVPIPLYPGKQRMRGFNQAQYLALRIASACGSSYNEDLLIKTKNTASQKKLDAAGRRRNLKKAFFVTKSLRGKSVLIIDDVYTTGSTIEAAGEILKENGASAVYFLTLCMVRKE